MHEFLRVVTRLDLLSLLLTGLNTCSALPQVLSSYKVALTVLGRGIFTSFGLLLTVGLYFCTNVHYFECNDYSALIIIFFFLKAKLLWALISQACFEKISLCSMRRNRLLFGPAPFFH